MGITTQQVSPVQDTGGDVRATCVHNELTKMQELPCHD